jgi:hypothetical protein
LNGFEQSRHIRHGTLVYRLPNRSSLIDQDAPSRSVAAQGGVKDA